MFARFRQTKTSLQVSVVATRRAGGRVRHEHVASLGAVKQPPCVEDRIDFWKRVHERLARLGNRLNAAAQSTILAAIHARIPMVTMEEQQALRIENAESDERFWERMHDMHASGLEDQKGMAAAVERSMGDQQAGLAAAAAKRDAARERRERLQRGEDVAGFLARERPPLHLAQARSQGRTTAKYYPKLTGIDTSTQPGCAKASSRGPSGSHRNTRFSSNRIQYCINPSRRELHQCMALSSAWCASGRVHFHPTGLWPKIPC
jgi:hypothetical protein